MRREQILLPGVLLHFRPRDSLGGCLDEGAEEFSEMRITVVEALGMELDGLEERQAGLVLQLHRLDDAVGGGAGDAERVGNARDGLVMRGVGAGVRGAEDGGDLRIRRERHFMNQLELPLGAGLVT